MQLNTQVEKRWNNIVDQGLKDPLLLLLLLLPQLLTAPLRRGRPPTPPLPPAGLRDGLVDDKGGHGRGRRNGGQDKIGADINAEAAAGGAAAAAVTAVHAPRVAAVLTTEEDVKKDAIS